MHIRYLITDYDNCAYSITSPRPDNLSQPVIDMARTGLYDGFYGCTHRAYRTYQLIDKVSSATKWVSRGYYTNAANNLNFPTYKITQNFAEATALPNISVSTLDDMVYPECGMGYNLLLKPYEMSKQLPDVNTSYLRTLSVVRELTSKNYQLTLIAKHAAALHPKADIVLDYVDDKANLCLHAVMAMTGDEWPKNVYLNTYHYANKRVSPIYEPERFFDVAECDEDVFFDVAEEFPEITVVAPECVEKEQKPVVSALRANSVFKSGEEFKTTVEDVLLPSQSAGITPYFEL